MANRIQLTVGNVRGTMANFNARRAEFDQLINALKAQGFNLEGSWKGESSRKFMDKYRELLNNLQSIDREIDKAVEKMNKAIQLYSALEEAQAAQAHGLDAGRSDYVH